MPSNTSLYDTDFHAWANEQASLLRAGRLSEADIENIAEEIEDMSKTTKRELTNRLTVLLLHLLKWRYQPDFQSKSWQFTIDGQREEVADHLRENPSLKPLINEALPAAYKKARRGAAGETGLGQATFPETCPFTFEDAMNHDFWPE